MAEKKKTRIPYGYTIVNGKAVIDPEQRQSLISYFRNYLRGDTMSAAAGAAGLTCSKTTYAHLFRRKEYLGDEYYPQIIDKEYQEKLIDEWTRRKKERPRKPQNMARQEVKIYTDFTMHLPVQYDSSDPRKCAEALFSCVHPCE